MAPKTEPDQPTIGGVSIPVDEHGRVSLNALHRASGAGDDKKPGQWLRYNQAKELIEELEASGVNSPQAVQAVQRGESPGTYAHPDLAISYAGWISPRFQLQVNRTFRQYQEGTLPAHPEPAPQPPLPKYEATRSLDQYLEMAQLLGVDPAMAKSVAARLTQEETGLPVPELLKEGGHTVEEKDRFLCPRDLVRTGGGREAGPGRRRSRPGSTEPEYSSRSQTAGEDRIERLRGRLWGRLPDSL